MKYNFSENQKEFAKEVMKQFTFEELALCFYDNECYFCTKGEENLVSVCHGTCSTKECVKNIRTKFENTYELEGR